MKLNMLIEQYEREWKLVLKTIKDTIEDTGWSYEIKTGESNTVPLPLYRIRSIEQVSFNLISPQTEDPADDWEDTFGSIPKIALNHFKYGVTIEAFHFYPSTKEEPPYAALVPGIDEWKCLFGELDDEIGSLIQWVNRAIEAFERPHVS